MCPSSMPASWGIGAGDTPTAAHSLPVTRAGLYPPVGKSTGFRAMPSMPGRGWWTAGTSHAFPSNPRPY